MQRRDIVIGSVVVLMVAGVLIWNQRRRPPEELVVPETLSSSVEEELEEKFNIQIPDDLDKAELSDVSGGNASGIGTRKFENETFTFSLVADLPAAEEGSRYQGWLIRGEEGSDDYSIVSAGRPELTKGGWTLDFESNTDYSDHGKVVVSQEITADNTPEKAILEGNF